MAAKLKNGVREGVGKIYCLKSEKANVKIAYKNGKLTSEKFNEKVCGLVMIVKTSRSLGGKNDHSIDK
ncbi:hypothetical protein [Campylobacter sp.]|uniref:hypothetical protein n=1 Tax=Campylobacter sp. TaxID=205 RepID=UPI0027108B6C|nr:hypothetical protein [Campylobacter sp.]